MQNVAPTPSVRESNPRDVPERARAPVELRVAHSLERVDEAARLALAHSGLRAIDQLAVVVEPIDLPVAVAAVDVFRRDLHGPRHADSGDVALEVQVVVEHLDPAVGAIRDVNVAVTRRDGVHGVELPVTAAVAPILL